MTDIKLHNTLTRRKEVFTPHDAKDVRMYVCGPTVYDRAHLGNARPVVVFDILYRLLRHVYGADAVTYARNFTDVDDKINARALENVGPEGNVDAEILKITGETTQWFLDDMGALGALEPDHMPRATQYIPQMVEMIKTLIDKGYAYSKPISWGHNSRAVFFNAKKAPEHGFFRVDKYDRYGELSGRSLDEMVAGSRAEVGEGKENPMDFVLWKPSTSNEPGWESPWGFGRPGWHIECSAMAKSLLGDTFDIHGGGLDLQFPHHENEIAQSCCANDTKIMAKYWMHNEMLQVEGKKMSKSLGNFFTVRDLLKQGVPGEVIRFVFLSTHYRSPMDWTEKKRKEAVTTLKSWFNLTAAEDGDRLGLPAIINCLSDDLNVSKAITIMHQLAESGEFAQLKVCMDFLGLIPSSDWWIERTVGNRTSFSYSGPLNTRMENTALDLASELSDMRSEALKTKNFDEFDVRKRAFESAGVEVQIEGVDVRLRVGDGFDPTNLEALK